MMFDNTKMELKVNMNGKEFMEYRKTKKLKLSKNQKLGIIYLGFSILGMIIIGLLISDLTPKEPVKGIFSSWYDNVDIEDNYSWNSIAKFVVLWSAPFLLVAIILGWIIHGVGFFIFKGS